METECPYKIKNDHIWFEDNGRRDRWVQRYYFCKGSHILKVCVVKQSGGILYYIHKVIMQIPDTIMVVLFAMVLRECQIVIGGLRVSHIQITANLIPSVTPKVMYC